MQSFCLDVSFQSKRLYIHAYLHIYTPSLTSLHCDCSLMVFLPYVCTCMCMYVCMCVCMCVFLLFAVLYRMGMMEDSVTGSAHCLLARYWITMRSRTHTHSHTPSLPPPQTPLSLPPSAVWLRGFQASPRGGNVTISMTTAENEGEKEVENEEVMFMRGRALTLSKGHLSVTV